MADAKHCDECKVMYGPGDECPICNPIAIGVPETRLPSGSLNGSIACGSSVGEENISERFERLKEQMHLAKDCNRHAYQFVQRIEMDLLRLMNSAILNCYDIVYVHEKEKAERGSEVSTS